MLSRRSHLHGALYRNLPAYICIIREGLLPRLFLLFKHFPGEPLPADVLRPAQKLRKAAETGNSHDLYSLHHSSLSHIPLRHKAAGEPRLPGTVDPRENPIDRLHLPVQAELTQKYGS